MNFFYRGLNNFNMLVNLEIKALVHNLHFLEYIYKKQEENLSFIL